MTHHNRILDFYASKTWAILEPSLQEMFQIYQAALARKELGFEFDPAAVMAKTGRPLDNTRQVTIRGNGVAVIPVSGPIFRKANLFTQLSGATSIEMLALDLGQAIDNRAVTSIILEVNSPGGEVDGVSELAQFIYAARQTKPMIAYVSGLGASAAYWLASACGEIVANDTASLGSIGVVGTVCVHKDKNHIEFVSSQSPNKRPDVATETGRGQIQQHIDDLAQVFIDTVARNRDMSAQEIIDKGAGGGLKVGKLAVDAGLADRTGTLEELIAELSEPGSTRSASSRTRAENESPTGDKPMADEPKDKTLEANAPKDVAADDKKLTDRIAAFFSEKFGASEAKPAPPDPQLETDRAVASVKAEAEAAKKEAAEAKAQVETLHKEARQARLALLAKDWAGEPSKHIAMLELIATTQEGGESSQVFTDYVAQANALTEQVNTGALLKEIGSTQPAEGSAHALVEGKVKDAQAANPTWTYEQAFTTVWQGLSPTLRAQHRDEEKRTIN